MGVDFLDFAFEIEKQFGVRLVAADLIEAPEWDSAKRDCTVGGLHQIICRKCEAEALPVPPGSWNRLRLALMRSLQVGADEVKEGVWLVHDLDFA